MRIYRVDGTIKSDSSDFQFGWLCSEIVKEEVVPYPAVKTKERKDVSGEPNFAVYHTRIPEYVAESAEGCLEDEDAENDGQIDFVNIDSAVPSKQQLSKLVKPLTLESRMLLSVIHNAKFMQLEKECFSPVKKKANSYYENPTSRATLYLLKDNRHIYSKILEKVISKNGDTSYNKNNVLSLMVELTLSDTPYRIEEIVIKKDVSKIQWKDRTIRNNDCYEEIDNRYACGAACYFKYSVLEDDLKLDHFCKTTCEMHAEISQIKKGYQVML